MKIQKIPHWANIVFFKRPKGLALIDTIYLSDDYYDQFKSGQASTELKALIAHESEHLNRQKKFGWSSIVRYYINRRFRLQEEIAATKVEINIFKQDGKVFDYGGRARSWSSINYFFMIGYEEAYQILTNL